jgi:hypothetical protein
MDADEAFVEVARERVPSADIVVGDMHALPYDNDCFDVVTGLFGSWAAGRAAASRPRRGGAAEPTVGDVAIGQ